VLKKLVKAVVDRHASEPFDKLRAGPGIQTAFQDGFGLARQA
jgi:hypothetical protein